MIGLDDPRTKSRLQVIDHKFTAIPLIFVLLRIGSVLVSVLFEYSKINEAGLPKWVAEILLYISVSQNYNYICHLVHIAACMHGEYLYSLSRHAFIQLYLISFTVSH